MEAGIDNPFTTRGVSYSDYDMDGDLDIIAVVLNVPMNGVGWQTILFQNQGDTTKNWVQFELEGTTINRDAYGSRVILFSDQNQWIQELVAGGSHASMHSNILHFGLDSLDKVDSIQVVWTGGKQEIFYDISINERHPIVESENEPSTVSHHLRNEQINLFPNPANDLLNITFDRPHENFLLDIYNAEGKKCLSSQKMSANKDHQINISMLPGGIYYVRLKNRKAHFVKKLIIQRY
jgi:hypothetical protein